MSAPLFKWLVRFMDSENKIHFGEVQEDQPASSDLVGLRVKVYEGNGPWDSRFILSSTERVISKLHLPALESDPNSGCVKDSKAANKYADTECPIEHVPIFLGVGLNYRKHAEEANVRLRPGLFWSMELEPLLISLQFPIPPYPMIFTKPSGKLKRATPYIFKSSLPIIILSYDL
jgi:hypothetical protein